MLSVPIGAANRILFYTSLGHNERAFLSDLIFPIANRYDTLMFFCVQFLRDPAIVKMSRFDDEKFKQLQLNVKFNIIPKTRLKKFGQLFTGYP